MYKASIGKETFEVITGDSPSVNGKSKRIGFATADGGRSFIMTIDGRSREADLVRIDKEAKEITIRMDGNKYTVQLKEPIDQLLEQLGMKSKGSRKMNQLKAPMPGLIIKVLAEVGQSYAAGEPLLILEAMKMENVFKAASDVVIKSIHVSEKQSVEKGQILVEFA